MKRGQLNTNTRTHQHISSLRRYSTFHARAVRVRHCHGPDSETQTVKHKHKDAPCFLRKPTHLLTAAVLHIPRQGSGVSARVFCKTRVLSMTTKMHMHTHQPVWLIIVALGGQSWGTWCDLPSTNLQHSNPSDLRLLVSKPNRTTPQPLPRLGLPVLGRVHAVFSSVLVVWVAGPWVEAMPCQAIHVAWVLVLAHDQMMSWTSAIKALSPSASPVQVFHTILLMQTSKFKYQIKATGPAR